MAIIALIAYLVLIVEYKPWKTKNAGNVRLTTRLAWWLLGIVVAGEAMLFIQWVIQ